MQEEKGEMSEEQIQAEVASLARLPVDEWERIPTLPLVEVNTPEFENAKKHARQSKDDIEGDVDGNPGQLNRKTKQLMSTLRQMLEQGTAQETPSGGYTEDQARVIFLWGASLLLESYTDALENGNPSSGAKARAKKAVRNILSDMGTALEKSAASTESATSTSGSQEQEAAGDITVFAVKCSTCYPSYQACIKAGRPPATCLNEYNNCTATCTPG
jgi:hypothetical protein